MIILLPDTVLVKINIGSGELQYQAIGKSLIGASLVYMSV